MFLYFDGGFSKNIKKISRKLHFYVEYLDQGSVGTV